ncbi:MAG: NAD-dependent protein deacetylase [Planctomycetes bacterium]|nr:NAD-dependent protein deacetylase [Planctomycetota bacterium]
MEPTNALVDLLRGRRLAVLTGAGCSTESGIPDYRGEGTARRARSPVQLAAFLADPEARRRYWARGAAGWPRLRAARPNAAHTALAALEARGVVAGLITQNVDRLHTAAGSREVIELHGALHEARCLGCGAREARDALQERLLRENPGFEARAAEALPDGDAALPAALVEGFRVVGCLACGGDLKPDVVFFGEAVPRARREAGGALLRAAEALLVAGSSLAVFSGFRFVREARALGLPVAIVNLGPTRGDGDAQLKVEGRLGEVLPGLAQALV